MSFSVYSRRLFAGTILLFIAACDGGGPVSAEKNNNATISGYEYCIPKGYIRVAHDPFSSSVLAEATYPEMKPVNDVSGPNKMESSFANLLTILWTEKSEIGYTPDVQKMLRNTYFLETKKREWGLIPTRKSPGNNMNDRWYAPETTDVGENYSSYVDCMPEGDRKHFSNPRCNQSFLLNDAYVEVSFPYALLPEWQQIKNQTVKLISSFKCDSPSS